MEEFDKMTPVRPPTVNKKTNPIAHSIGVSIEIWELFIVANQLNTLTPVGMAIIIVAEVKYARVSTSIPTVNMWCAHTINPKNPIETIA